MGKYRCLILYLHGDPDHSQNIMGYKMDQDPSSDLVHDGPFSSICIIGRFIF